MNLNRGLIAVIIYLFTMVEVFAVIIVSSIAQAYYGSIIITVLVALTATIISGFLAVAVFIALGGDE